MEITLKYKSEYAQLIGYSDADLAGDLDDRHSTTGHMFLMNGGPVSWFSKKQSIVTFSTAESEYVALSPGTQEATWSRRLLSNIPVPLEPATFIMEENQAAICTARNPVIHTEPSTSISTITMSGKLLLKGQTIYSLVERKLWLQTF